MGVNLDILSRKIQNAFLLEQIYFFPVVYYLY